MNLIARLEYELAYYDSAVHRFNHYTTRTPPTFELWGRPFCLSLLVSFFWCCYERNSIHTAPLSHFISLIHSAYHLFFFLSSHERLLNSRKYQLFCLHIQHGTGCLFERRTPVGSLEAAVCGFCLSISLHKFNLLPRNECFQLLTFECNFRNKI